MELLTIGAFARATRLSIKALRLYDELGLLRPVRVDPFTGYRYYDRSQVERARLVVWLRRLGLPLARIQEVCELPPSAAAEAVRTFWAQVEADTATRRDLAAFLIDQLNRKDTAMPLSTAPMEIRYAALSDIGRARESNQDTAYAGARLLAVADGFGPSGAPASAAAVAALKRLESGEVQAADLLNALQDAVDEANQAVHEIAAADSADPGQEAGPATPHPGTTLTAMLWTGSQLALVHLGDSRAYLLRAGEFFQITHDHTVVQSMLDEGRLTPEEAASHPQRALLIRALDGRAALAPELRLHEAHVADRYLLCTDGLSSVLPDEELRRVVSTVTGPDQAVQELVDLANAAGGPDNIACVVADVISAG
jgi:PPM family protein phosphatase